MSTRPFFDVARDIRQGMFLDECADKLQEVVRAVDETGKSAKLVIEISVTPAARVGGADCRASRRDCQAHQGIGGSAEGC